MIICNHCNKSFKCHCLLEKYFIKKNTLFYKITYRKYDT